MFVHAAFIILTPVTALPVADHHFRGNPMPNRPGCVTTHCEPMWDHELQRPFKRCWWRCPRERRPGWHSTDPERLPDFKERDPPPAPPPRPTPQYEALMPVARAAPAGNPNLVFLGLGIAAILGLVWLVDRLQTIASLRSAERATQLALYDAQEAADAQAALESAARAAEKIIKRQAARAFRRGRYSS